MTICLSVGKYLLDWPSPSDSVLSLWHCLLFWFILLLQCEFVVKIANLTLYLGSVPCRTMEPSPNTLYPRKYCFSCRTPYTRFNMEKYFPPTVCEKLLLFITIFWTFIKENIYSVFQMQKYLMIRVALKNKCLKIWRFTPWMWCKYGSYILCVVS